MRIRPIIRTIAFMAAFIFIFVMMMEAEMQRMESCERNPESCLSSDELECREACSPGKYFFKQESFGVECECGEVPKD